MKRILCLSIFSVLGLAAPAWAGLFCCNHGIHCITPPPACPDCSEPCCDGHHHCSCRKSEQAQRLIEQLHCDCCCDRINAAHKLGCRLHADYCCTPEVLTSLVQALQCDTCWKVRKTAAWSIAYQGARTRMGVLSLYLASKLDPNFLVRDAAADALDVLIVCRRECYKDLFEAADQLAKKLAGSYQPTKGQCVNIFDQCVALSGMAPTITVEGMPGTPELLSAPATGK
ncbi:MAG TPA: HEAT repeat domain-containing protein [Gemmataceae bacterium]|nr:HEAT repeat domain-containing protein [Gemmataceae bacterium]